jgi:hypothetical protein
MKTYTLDIHPELKNVTFTVKDGKKFEELLRLGKYNRVFINVSEKDMKRVKQFAVRKGNDKSSCHGNWYAHCNGYAMDLCITGAGKYISINTYRPYNRSSF